MFCVSALVKPNRDAQSKLSSRILCFTPCDWSFIVYSNKDSDEYIIV